MSRVVLDQGHVPGEAKNGGRRRVADPPEGSRIPGRSAPTTAVPEPKKLPPGRISLQAATQPGRSGVIHNLPPHTHKIEYCHVLPYTIDSVFRRRHRLRRVCPQSNTRTSGSPEIPRDPRRVEGSSSIPLVPCGKRCRPRGGPVFGWRWKRLLQGVVMVPRRLDVARIRAAVRAKNHHATVSRPPRWPQVSISSRPMQHLRRRQSMRPQPRHDVRLRRAPEGPRTS